MNNCIECGHCYELHSADGARCPKNDGELVNGKLEFFATHYEPGIPEIDQLHARIAELEARVIDLTLTRGEDEKRIAELESQRDNLTNLLKQGADLVNEYAAENARLTAAHEMQGESLVVLPRWMVSKVEEQLKSLRKFAENCAKLEGQEYQVLVDEARIALAGGE